VSVYVPAPITEVTTTSTAMSRARGQGHHTDFWYSTHATIHDQWSRIRIKELPIEVHQRAVVEGRNEGETLLDKDTIAIDVGHSKETPVDAHTIISKEVIKQLRGERGGMRFHLSKQETDIPIGEIIIMVSPRASPITSSHSSRNHEYPYDGYPPPLLCHGFPFLRCSHVRTGSTLRANTS
jgi:hypothetical protein